MEYKAVDYKLVELNGDPSLKLYGVRFMEGNFMYWHKSTFTDIKQAMVVFSNKDANVVVNDKEVVLLLNGLKDISSLENAIIIFKNIFKGNDYEFKFIATNHEEEELRDRIIKDLELETGNKKVSSIEEKKKLLLDEIMSDPLRKQVLYGKSDEEIDAFLNNIISPKRIDSENVYQKNTDKDLSGSKDVDNNLLNNNFNTFSGGTNNTSNIITSDTTIDNDKEVSNKVFYIDPEYNLYDENYKFVSKVGINGYVPDYNNNTILKDGKVIGYIGDYKDNNKGNELSTPKVRVYKKSEYSVSSNNQNKSKAFVRLPVIIFIISLLLLIASLVLLFVVE